jgi:Mn-containing catalase
MYHHVKKLMFTVRVDEPDPRFGNMLLEQFGGANGELAAAMQYSIQGLNCEDPDRKDLLMDIGTEELSHLEIVGCLARMHLKPSKFDRQAAEADPLIAIAGGGGVNLFNSQGNPWTADYLKRGDQRRPAIPDDAGNHAYEGLRAGAGEHGQAGL